MEDKLLEEIKSKLISIMPEESEINIGFQGIKFYRRNNAEKSHICMQCPCIIFVANGEKHTHISSENFIFKKGYYNITYIDYPVASFFYSISENNPYLSVYMPVDNSVITEIIKDINHIPAKIFKGISENKADNKLLAAYSRLIDLYNKPDEISFMAQLIIKEIYYRILIGPVGADLKALYTFGSQSNKIYQAVEFIKDNYKEYLHIDDIASKVNMAPSTFFRNFKAITMMSPLQYQKRLRLYEAQRLMLAESITASDAAYTVGYESITQFTREYKKLFHSSPARNIKEIINGKAAPA
ncbi:MAG: AraC family transcriptional regulator [Mucispirillum sp.]|nr:AraC family transcriptional regulator [Mucispirillum sp.]